MADVLVAQSWQPRRSMTGWGASLPLHVCLGLVAFGLMPKMAMMVEKEPFTWDVALVETPRQRGAGSGTGGGTLPSRTPGEASI